MTIAEHIAHCHATIAHCKEEIAKPDCDELGALRGLADWTMELREWQAEAARQGA